MALLISCIGGVVIMLDVYINGASAILFITVCFTFKDRLCPPNIESRF